MNIYRVHKNIIYVSVFVCVALHTALSGMASAKAVETQRLARDTATRAFTPCGSGASTAARPFAGHRFRLHVAAQPFVALDRVVDGAYAVLLVGPTEDEVIVPLQPVCAPRVHCLAALVAPGFSGSSQRNRRFNLQRHRLRRAIEQKQQLLRRRGLQMGEDGTVPVTRLRPASPTDSPADATGPF